MMREKRGNGRDLIPLIGYQRLGLEMHEEAETAWDIPIDTFGAFVQPQR